MDPVALGVIASFVTILGFVYFLVFGQRNLMDSWTEFRSSLKKETSELDKGYNKPQMDQPRLGSGTSHVYSARSNQTQNDTTRGSPLVDANSDWLDSIAHEIENKSCVFFLGAGISIEAGLLSGRDLAEKISVRAGWAYKGESLSTITQNYVTRIGPVKPLIQEILKKRQREAGPADSHYAIALLARHLDNVFTTNWDTLLEDAFDQIGGAREYVCLYRDAHLPSQSKTKTCIVKIHGHIDDTDSYVVTEDDYLAFREKNPKLCDYLRYILTSNTLILVGYSLEDDDFRFLYEEALNQFKGEERRSVYIVNPREDGAWTQYWRDKARARIIHQTANDFFRSLLQKSQAIADRDLERQLSTELVLLPQRKPVIEFSGLPGVGKTTLLRAIRHEYAMQSIPHAWIDFANQDFCQDSNASRRLIWQHIMQGLGLELEFDNRVALREQLHRKRQAVLFADTVECVAPKTLAWLGEVFIATSDEFPDFRTIVACRSPRLLNELPLPLKRKVSSLRLTPFKRFEDTRRQMALAFLFDENLARQVFELTHGHPGLVAKVIHWLAERRVKGAKDLNTVANQDLYSFVDHLLDSFILEGIADDLKPIIRRLSYYRQFSYEQIGRAIDKTTVPAASFFRERLFPTGIFSAVPGTILFSVDHVAREMILGIALVGETQDFVSHHQTLLAEYEQMAARQSENWHFYVVECLYHLANTAIGQKRTGQAQDPKAVLVAHLAGYLGAIQNPIWVKNLQERLERETMESDYGVDSTIDQVEPGLYAQVLQQVVDRRITLEREVSK